MDDRRRDGGTNSTLRIKEQETRLNLQEHDDDDDDDDDEIGYPYMSATCFGVYLGHPHASVYKHLTKEGTVTVIMLKLKNIKYKSIRKVIIKKYVYKDFY